MSALELSQHVGKLATWVTCPEIGVQVKILDAKLAYGRMRYRIQPVAGDGWKWVESSSVTDIREEGKANG